MVSSIGGLTAELEDGYLRSELLDAPSDLSFFTCLGEEVVSNSSAEGYEGRLGSCGYAGADYVPAGNDGNLVESKVGEGLSNNPPSKGPEVDLLLEGRLRHSHHPPFTQLCAFVLVIVQ
ncbi:hypothetical protein [Thermococcus peptonophilus]|uniref:hypothetical protein n=1 Tax=Thermococcus peptonophilus TaxID=53952 RepID=UPI003466C001